MVIMTQKQFDAEINKVYIRAYQLGLEAGRQESLMSKVTPNDLREALGLPKIKDGDTQWLA